MATSMLVQISPVQSYLRATSPASATSDPPRYLGGTNVVIAGLGGNGDGVIGYASSSRRYKHDIADMDKASETLFALKPVTFRARGHSDQAHVKYYGLIAEDVATVDPDLVVYNPEGKHETLRFDSINAMLLNEFLKEHRKVEQLEKQVEALTAGLQKVSAQVETSKAAPLTVVDNQ
jgi:Chaperone of endosialidase